MSRAITSDDIDRLERRIDALQGVGGVAHDALTKVNAAGERISALEKRVAEFNAEAEEFASLLDAAAPPSPAPPNGARTEPTAPETISPATPTE